MSRRSRKERAGVRIEIQLLILFSLFGATAFGALYLVDQRLMPEPAWLIWPGLGAVPGKHRRAHDSNVA